MRKRLPGGCGSSRNDEAAVPRGASHVEDD
jgi:hypothetical protein